MAEAFSGGENHGYRTFRSNAQAVAACAVVSAALGTVAPPTGQLPAAVHCVHCDVLHGLTVYTWNDALPACPSVKCLFSVETWPPKIERGGDPAWGHLPQHPRALPDTFLP